MFFCFELSCLFFLHILHCLFLQWFPKSLKSLWYKFDLLLPDFLVLSRWRNSLKGISYFFSFFGDSSSITRIYWWVASTVADLWKLLPFLFVDYLTLEGNLNFSPIDKSSDCYDFNRGNINKFKLWLHEMW